MNTSLFIILVIVACIATPLPVLLIPRERHSPVFDAVLWIATLVVAFLAGWLAVVWSTDSLPALAALVVISGAPALAALLGAIGGALVVNLPLWFLDYFDRRNELLQDYWDDDEPDE